MLSEVCSQGHPPFPTWAACLVLTSLIIDDWFMAFHKGDGAQQWSCFGWLILSLLLQGDCEHCQNIVMAPPVLSPVTKYTLLYCTTQSEQWVLLFPTGTN